jgi:hypothetical protein
MVKQLVLMVVLAMQLTAVSATQPRFSDPTFEARNGPGWYCFLAVAGNEQSQQQEEIPKQKTEEEPDCE